MIDSDVAIASHAEAYAALGVEALRSVLDPNLRFHQVDPGGHLTLDTADD